MARVYNGLFIKEGCTVQYKERKLTVKETTTATTKILQVTKDRLNSITVSKI